MADLTLKPRTHLADLSIAIGGRFTLDDSSWFRISNMFNKSSQPTYMESVVEFYRFNCRKYIYIYIYIYIYMYICHMHIHVSTLNTIVTY